MEKFTKDLVEGWTKDDKLLLLHALRSHGTGNIKVLQKCIPNKTVEEVEKAILYFQHRASKQEEEKESRRPLKETTHVPLNAWAKLLTETIPFDELRTKTASAIRLIADFEDIPPATCTENIDFRKVYHTIANALEGKALDEDEGVAAVLDKSVTEAALTSKAFMKCSTVKNGLNDIKIDEKDISAFIKPTDNNELSAIRDIRMRKNYNPMNISEELLKFSK